MILLFSDTVLAGVLLEVGGTYYTDNLGTNSTVSSSKYSYNLDLMFSIKKKLWAGWHYSGFSFSESGSSTTTLGSQDSGPAVKWQFGRGDLYQVTAAYNVFAQATYNNGSSDEAWQGTSIWLQYAIVPMVKEGLHVGAAVNYYSASYTKKTVDSIESASSNTRTWIYPSILFTKEW